MTKNPLNWCQTNSALCCFYRNFNSKHRWHSSETQAPAFIFSGSISLAISSFLISAIVLGPFFSLVPAKPWPDSRSSKLASEALGLGPDREEYDQKYKKHLFKLINFSPWNIRWTSEWLTERLSWNLISCSPMPACALTPALGEPPPIAEKLTL